MREGGSVKCGRRNRSAAFTLVELVLVLAIIAVLGAMVAPRYGEAMNRYRVESAAKRIAADFAFAQSRARAASTSRTITFNAAGTYQIPNENDLNTSATNYTVDLTTAPYYVGIGTINFASATAVTFNGFGVPDKGGYVQIQAGASSKTISIDATTG